MLIKSIFTKSRFLTLALLVLMSLMTSANASRTLQNCENKQAESMSYSQCLDEVKNAVERELQTWINNQTFILEELESTTGKKSTLTMFKRSQSNFITFRNNNCRWQYLAVSSEANAGDTYKKCYISTSQSRIKELSTLAPE